MTTTLEYARAAPPPPDPIPLRRRLAAEFVGTFMLVFFGCGSMAVDAAYGGAVGHVGIGLTWGLVVMAMIYAVGDVSGAHLNPAVSFGFAVAGRFRATDALAYSGAQVFAATAAAGALLLAFPTAWDIGQSNPTKPPFAGLGHEMHARPINNNTEVLAQDYFERVVPMGQWLEGMSGIGLWPEDIGRAFAFEIVLTFALVFVILCVAVGSKERGLMAGIAIGGTVGICALAAGPVSRASMNPARSIGPAVAALDFQHLWIYCTAPFLGAVAAVAAWTYIYRHPRSHGATSPGRSR